MSQKLSIRPFMHCQRHTEVNVVSTELVPSKAAGSTHKYYKVSFNANDKVQNNATLYMKYKVPGMYYIDSRYLNFAQNGESRPEGMTLGEIKSGNVKKSSYKVTDISKLEPADIVKDEFVFRWNPGKNNTDFTVTLSTSKDTGAKANRTSVKASVV